MNWMTTMVDPQLYRAISRGDETGLQSLYGGSGGDWNVLPKETAQGNTLLHVAALHRQTQIARIILSFQPSLLYSRNSSDEDSPLHIAARLGYLEIVQLLIDCADAESSSTSSGAQIELYPTRMVNLARDTVLHDAVRNGHLAVVEFLLARDPGLAQLLNAAGESPLFLAVERKRFDIAKHLLHNAQVCSYEGRDGMNALHAATLRFCELGLLKEMVSKCSTAVVQADNLGCTPLHCAAILGYKEAVELFLTDESVLAYKNTLAYKIDKQGMSTFHMAAKNGHVQVMEKLMEICPDIAEQLNCINRQTALHVAVQGGKDKAVEYLLTRFGLEGLINKQDTDGNTALHLAAINEVSPILEILVNGERFDANLVNKDGLTAIDIMQSSTQLDILQKQQLVGANIGMEEPMQTERELEAPEENSKDQRDRPVRSVRMRKALAVLRFFNPLSVGEDASNNDILIATIIATVTFSAAFQAPGGYESDGPHQGLPLFRNKPGFNSFIIFDSLAFGLSSGSIFLHFLASITDHGNSTSARNYCLQTALASTFYSILAMIGAFISAVFLVSEDSSGLRIAAFVSGCSFVYCCLSVCTLRWMDYVASKM
ncbi:hypothetical protein FNV43_RR02749 [Rhamnella rubrinervis]|uniref:PGG domain-containing protein n=1 Tax=Rhamnella rubrinervis TaxID=2594499 RepID=A0A8K0MN22_9ROSA|nr:hypothetical protein FNV43_RR02749 [Rhamnella rubrinervis]